MGDIDTKQLEQLISNYINDTHIGSLEKYMFDRIISAEWYDKTNQRILVTYSVHVESHDMILSEEDSKYTEKVIVTDYMSITKI